MRKITAFFLITLLAGFLILIHVPMSGRFVDAYFSRVLSGALAVKVTGAEVVLRHWGQISFGAIEIGKEGKGAWLVAREGSLKWAGDKRVLSAKEADLLPSALKEAPFLGSLLSGNGESARSVRNLRIFWDRDPLGSTVRVTSLESDDFWLKGGLRLDPEDRPIKLHAQVLVAPDLWKKLPEDLSKRLLKRSGDFRGLRFVWVHEFIRVDGATGPLLVAGWQKPD